MILQVYEAHEVKERGGEITLSSTSPEKEKYFYIFMM
jgi:hypothetical protein